MIRVGSSHHAHGLEGRCVGNQAALVTKFGSGSTRNARFIRGTEHGNARLATALLSDQRVDGHRRNAVSRREAHAAQPVRGQWQRDWIV